MLVTYCNTVSNSERGRSMAASHLTIRGRPVWVLPHIEEFVQRVIFFSWDSFNRWEKLKPAFPWPGEVCSTGRRTAASWLGGHVQPPGSLHRQRAGPKRGCTLFWTLGRDELLRWTTSSLFRIFFKCRLCWLKIMGVLFPVCGQFIWTGGGTHTAGGHGLELFSVDALCVG